MTSISDLPSPVLIKILSLVDVTTLNECIFVSNKWDFVISNFIGFDVHIPDKRTYSELARTRIRWLWISSDIDVVGEQSFPRTRYPAAVRFLRLFGSISLPNFNLVVEGFVNLRQLELGWLNLEIFGLEDQAWHSFPQLHSIKLAGPDADTFDDDNLPDSRILRNHSGLMSVLENMKFPKLSELDVEGLFFEWSANLFVHSLMTFLSSHQETLRKVSIALTWAPNLMDERPQDNRAFSSEDWHSVPDFDQRLTNLQLSLKYFFLHFMPYYDSPSFTRLVEHVTNTQTSIESSIVLWPHFPLFSNQLPIDNQRTLSSIAFSMHLEQSFDCKVFEKCFSLEKILISAQPKSREEFETENYGGQPAKSQLLGIGCLPQTLTHIQFVNFFIETKDLETFVSDFPELYLLNLRGIGEKEELGFTLQMLAILAHRRIFEVGTYRGFNKRNLAEAQASSNGALAFMTLALMEEEEGTNPNNIESLAAFNARNCDGEWEQLLGSCPRQILRNELIQDHRVMFKADVECGDYFKAFQT